MTEHARSRLTTTRHSGMAVFFNDFFDSRVSLIPWLGLSTLGIVTSLYIFFTVPPSQVANVLAPHLYLPLQMSVALSTVATSIYLWRHLRRGLLSGLAIQTLFFLFLQRVHIDWQLIGAVLISFVIMEIGFTYLDTRSPQSHATPIRRRHRFDHAQRSAI